jgi:hypothetical protein
MRLMNRRLLVSIFAGLILLALVACSATDGGDLTLDLDTLQARGLEGVYQAQPISNAQVGETTEGLFISVALDETVEEGEPQPVTVYLCDGEEFSQWLTGEVDAEGRALLEEEMGAKVALAIEDDGEASGLVQVPGREIESFTTTAATGEAGLYRAEETFDGEKRVAGWIVLNDGRQKGFPPCCVCDCECGCSPYCCQTLQ